MLYRFEDYSLDPSRRELRRGRDLVAIEPLAFDLLEFLVRNRHRIVGKDLLIGEVWKRRAVSDSALSSRMTAVRHAVGDDAKEQRLIRTVPRRGFRFIGAVREEGEPGRGLARPFERGEPLASAGVDTPSRPGDKRAIAVLPFAHDGRNPDLEGFVDGIVEDITTALARYRWLSVAARSSSFAHRGWSVDIRHVERDLCVHHVLEGSVRTIEGRVRITARLIDTATLTCRWANRFDLWLEDIVTLQDHITASVVGAIGPKLEQVEIARARRRPPESPDSTGCYLRGMGSLYQWSREGIADALSHFQRAIEIDPEFAGAYGMAAYCYVQRKSYGWITDRAKENAECERLARRAAELAGDDAFALSKAAHAIATVMGDVDSGAVFVEQALRLDPNLAAAWYVSGWIRLILGEPEVAVEHQAHAIRLSPCDPLILKMRAALAYAHFFAGRYDDASTMAASALCVRPTYLTAVRGAAASHALAGRLAESRRLIARMHELDPALRVSNLPDLIPFHRSDHFAKWADALRRAGLPD